MCVDGPGQSGLGGQGLKYAESFALRIDIFSAGDLRLRKEGFSLPHIWMTEQETRQFLADNTIGRLATCDGDGQPYVTAVNYVYRDNKIYFHCGTGGHRLDNIAVNPKVCFEVSREDELIISARACSSSTRYTSAVAFGVAGLVTEAEEKAAVLNLFMAKLAPDAVYHPVTAQMTAGCTVVEISISKISGKRNVNADSVC